MANIPPDDAELEHLLTRLLRMLSPAFGTLNNVLVSRAGEAVDRSGNGGPDLPPVTAADGVGGPVSATEARALIELVTAHGIAQGELAGLLALDKSTVSRLAAGLERKGWVRRGRDETNQRYVRLYLTAAGGEAAARVWQAWQAREARILASLSEDERAGLAAGLRGLIRGLSADRGQTGPAADVPRQAAGFR
jgi:DNA-binding MarR family transcriptional regulator